LVYERGCEQRIEKAAGGAAVRGSAVTAAAIAGFLNVTEWDRAITHGGRAASRVPNGN